MANAFAGYTVGEDSASRGRLETVHAELAKLNALAREIPSLERRLADLQSEPPNAPYRAENAADLRRELEEARAATSKRRRLRIEEASLLREVESERRHLEQRGVRRMSLNVLDNVEIASPCSMSWANMEGDGDVRHCEKCAKDVYNLSMMTREEAAAVLHAEPGKEICVRLFRREDGTVLTQDCPIGERRQRFCRRTKGIASAGLIAAGIGMMAMHYFASKCVVQEAGSMGATSYLPPG